MEIQHLSENNLPIKINVRLFLAFDDTPHVHCIYIISSTVGLEITKGNEEYLSCFTTARIKMY